MDLALRDRACAFLLVRGRDEINRVAAEIKATHPDFRYQPIVGPEESGNGGDPMGIGLRNDEISPGVT